MEPYSIESHLVLYAIGSSSRNQDFLGMTDVIIVGEASLTKSTILFNSFLLRCLGHYSFG